MSKRLVNITELAKYLSISKSRIYHAVCAGEIPSYKVLGKRLFDLNEIDAWLEQHADKKGVPDINVLMSNMNLKV